MQLLFAVIYYSRLFYRYYIVQLQTLGQLLKLLSSLSDIHIKTNKTYQ